jgi:hypothetical protein
MTDLEPTDGSGSVYHDTDDTPIDLRPDLTVLGIDEVDRGVCHDTMENRKLLRINKIQYQIVVDDRGAYTPFLRAISPESMTEARISLLDKYEPIMADPRDRNSDYLTEEELLVEERADIVAPPWVLQANKTWIRIRKRREEDPSYNGMPSIGGPPQRCRYMKSDGIRCLKWTSGRRDDDGLCVTHLPNVRLDTQGAIAAARLRVMQSAPRAVEVLEDLLESAESEPVKLKAATELLDRAGVRGGFEIDQNVAIDVRPAAEILQERLKTLLINVTSAPLPELEAEVIESEEGTISDADRVEVEHRDERGED